MYNSNEIYKLKADLVVAFLSLCAQAECLRNKYYDIIMIYEHVRHHVCNIDYQAIRKEMLVK